MNRIISDTAEYGCYLFNQSCLPLLKNFMKNIDKSVLGEINIGTEIDNTLLNKFDTNSMNHPIEKIGKVLRSNMSNMKKIN